MQPLLECVGLSVDFRGHGVKAVCEASLHVMPGEAVGLLGPSGSGKSTLAWSLLNLHQESALIRGSVWFEGRNLADIPKAEMRNIRGRDISLISQDPASALHPTMRVGDQLREVFRAHSNGNPAECERRIKSSLSDVSLPPEERILKARPHQLSSGECQRSAIAQALICGPRLLVADEPTSAMDESLQEEVLSLLRTLKSRGRTALLIITHNPAILEGLVDRVLVMSEGRIVESGPLRNVYDHPSHPFTKEVLRVWKSPARTRPMPAAALTPLVTAKGLTKVYHQQIGLARRRATVKALDGVDFTIRKSATVALVGRSGSGKSTLGRCLAGLEEPTSGTVRRASTDHREIQYVFPDSLTAMNPFHSISEIVVEPIRLRAHIPNHMERVKQLLDMVGLPLTLGSRRPAELSGGQRQRVAVARALGADPQALILDECFSGLDLPVQSQLADLLLGLRESHGLALVFIVHDRRLAHAVADEIVVMQSGRIVMADSILAEAS